MTRAIRCHRCRSTYADEPCRIGHPEDAEILTQVHPDAAEVSGAFLCPSCSAKSAVIGRQQAAALRALAAAERAISTENERSGS